MPRKVPISDAEKFGPVRTFGCPVDPERIRPILGDKTPFFYWQWAFAHHKDCINQGAPPRNELFWMIADVLMPGYFIRDPWSERIVDALCFNGWNGIAGCSGCVDGKTRLLDPITGEQPTFDYLHRNQINPTVMTLDGPVVAEIPYVKGVKELYEITLENGSRFTCTASHQVLVQGAFVRVEFLQIGQSLFSYSPTPRASTSEPYRSIHAPDARGSQRTASDLKDHYSLGFRLCGEQLRFAQESCRSSPPLQDGVPSNTHGRLSLDDLAEAASHIHHEQQFSLPSNWDSSPDRSSLDNPSQLPRDPKRLERDENLCESLLRCRSTRNSRLPFLEQAPCFLSKHLEHNPSAATPPGQRTFSNACRLSEECEPSPLSINPAEAFPISCHETSGRGSEESSTDSIRALSALELRVSQSKVVSIRNTGRRIYYDISVPGPEHYFAEGAIHHNSAKTHVVTGFCALWWLCDPARSSVLICSTTAKALRKRNWANIHKLHSFPNCSVVGNFVDSRMTWQAKRGDDLYSISGIAVEEGDTKASGDKIKGTHTKRQMVIVNEANSVNAGIWEAIYNLYSYPEQCGGEFIVVAEANPSSWLDEFGKFTEPLKGVKSVSVDDEEWETTPKLNGKTGICIRFDVEKTPNLDYPADRPINKHIPSRDRAERCMRSPQRDSPLYWSNERGFPPPEGLNKNVFSEVMMHQCGSFERHIFTGNRFQIIGAFDPSRGGDKPTLRFAALGELENGNMGIEWMLPKHIPVDLKNSNPIDYQLLEQVRNECEHVEYRGTKTTCPPENLGIDATGGGSNLCDTFQRHWDFGIIRIGFGESASTDAVSPEDVRPANEVYMNRRAEMYFRTQGGLQTSQIKGVDIATAKEMCTIEYDDSKAKRKVSSKDDYKKKYGKSPDDTDSGIILTEVARRKGFVLAVLGQTKARRLDVDKYFEKSQERFTQPLYAADNEDDPGPTMTVDNPFEVVGGMS